MLNIKKELRRLKNESENNLERAVITNILSKGTNEEIGIYIQDLLNHGCVSGMVSSLIYYADTEKFFKKHYKDIFNLYNEFLEEVGEPPLKELNPNNLAWFGYEETARQICYKLNLNIEI